MALRVTGSFVMKAWEEEPYQEIEGGRKLTRAHVKKSYHGEIQGEGSLEYLMFYRDEGVVTFVGLERIVGSLAGRKGSFVLQHTGTFEGSAVQIRLSVVPGSGTEALTGLSGHGEFSAGHETSYPMSLEVVFAEPGTPPG
ncbi:MAG: DUF3224 domain-containing protein [Acidobacteria bacterium]|nr:DUF3224 domain-containing protein [Acidobacteriota bacterium]